MANSQVMKRLITHLGAIILVLFFGASMFGQGLAPSPTTSSPPAAGQFEAIIKKIDEQNAKIDTLSQQILKLEQQLASSRPGVMIGEATPATSTSSPAAQPSASASPNGNSHVVARGETLTSIAKMHNVSVIELQKFNHIENDRKLQIGQTIMVPGPAAPAASASPPGG